MALDKTKLERIGGGRYQLWLYNATADTIATVTTSGYFNNCYECLRQGDVIQVVSNSNAAIDNVVVTSATGATTVTTSAVEGSTAT
jgi:ssDNA-binding replication factor A large subunit